MGLFRLLQTLSIFTKVQFLQFPFQRYRNASWFAIVGVIDIGPVGFIEHIGSAEWCAPVIAEIPGRVEVREEISILREGGIGQGRVGYAVADGFTLPVKATA